MPSLREMSRDELIALIGVRDERIARQDAQIAVLAGQVAELTAANEVLAAKLAKLEHLLSRNSSNSSSPPSKDDDPGRTPPQGKKRRGRRVSSGGPRGRTWRGPRFLTIVRTGFLRAPASAGLGWPGRGIWGSSTGISSTRFPWWR